MYALVSTVKLNQPVGKNSGKSTFLFIVRCKQVNRNPYFSYLRHIIFQLFAISIISFINMRHHHVIQSLCYSSCFLQLLFVIPPCNCTPWLWLLCVMVLQDGCNGSLWSYCGNRNCVIAPCNHSCSLQSLVFIDFCCSSWSLSAIAASLPNHCPCFLSAFQNIFVTLLAWWLSIVVVLFNFWGDSKPKGSFSCSFYKSGEFWVHFIWIQLFYNTFLIFLFFYFQTKRQQFNRVIASFLVGLSLLWW